MSVTTAAASADAGRLESACRRFCHRQLKRVEGVFERLAERPVLSLRDQKQALDRQSPGLDFDDDLNIAIGGGAPELGARGRVPRGANHSVSDATWCNATRISSSSSCSCSWWSDILVPSQTGLPATVMQEIWARALVDAGCVARGPRQVRGVVPPVGSHSAALHRPARPDRDPGSSE